jgi:hypothetical protein
VEIGERGSGELLWALAKAASNIIDVTSTRVFFKGASSERAVDAGKVQGDWTTAAMLYRLATIGCSSTAVNVQKVAHSRTETEEEPLGGAYRCADIYAVRPEKTFDSLPAISRRLAWEGPPEASVAWGGPLIDSAARFVLICDYTGKEVVG